MHISEITELNQLVKIGEEERRRRNSVNDNLGDIFLILTPLAPILLITVRILTSSISILKTIIIGIVLTLICFFLSTSFYISSSKYFNSKEELINSAIKKNGGYGLMSVKLISKAEKLNLLSEGYYTYLKRNKDGVNEEIFNILKNDGFDGTLDELILTSKKL